MSTRARMQDTLERLERWMREHQPAFLDAMQPGATDAELDDLERAIGRKLPDDVRAFYRWRNGIQGGVPPTVGVVCPFWQRPLPLDEIRHEYEECCGYAEADWADLGHPTWWHNGWVPIMSNDNGDFICVDAAGVWTGVGGQIVRFWHDDSGRAILAGSLGEWLRILVTDLERDRVFQPDDRNDRSPHGYPQYHDAAEEPIIPEVPSDDPNPLRPGFAEAVRLGDRVRITSGSFRDTQGEVKRLEPGTWMVTVVVTFWGRPLDVELEQHQIEIVERANKVPVAGDWNGCEDPYQLSGFIGFATSVRKLRLFVEDCCRNLLGDYPEAATVLAAIEECVEGRNDRTALREAAADFECDVGTPPDAPENFRTAIHTLFQLSASQKTLESLAPQMIRLGFGAPDLIREVFPNPFAPPRFELAWRSSDVVGLARAIYEQRAFDQMPILADALQDAGCDNDDILNHCRSASTHVRGCWALDLCLRLE